MKNTGVKFEKRIFEVINKTLNEEKLGLLPSSCKVFIDKGYYSKDRDKDIKADISIEVYVENATEPSVIWIWECKDYKGSISVDEIEEFHAKLEQIGADKTKGTLITSNGAFQKSSINYAKSKGIGLARLMPNDQVSWELYMMLPDMLNESRSNRNNTFRALTQTRYMAEKHNFFSLTSDSKLTKEYSISEFILYELKSTIRKIKN